ncbi:MAG: hypothetical protein ABI838_04560 [Chloroflexota bacterium]
MPDLNLDSRIRDVLEATGDRGRDLLFKHGYDLGEGFVDSLSQWQTLETAARAGRLRDVEALLKELHTL